MLSLALFVAGWYGPRTIQYYSDFGKSIVQRPAPYQVTAAGDVILDGEFNHPLVEPPTIPSTLLVFTSLQGPFLLLALLAWWTTRTPNNSSGNNSNNNNNAQSSSSLPWRTVHELHASLCGFVATIGLSEGATQLLKLYMQRRRPNFYALCAFDKVTRTCTAAEHRIQEAQFSFPSGHSSLSNSAMTFLVWYGLGKLCWAVQQQQQQQSSPLPLSSPSSNSNSGVLISSSKRVQALLTCCVPWGWAVFVAASRVADTWHHPSDVVAGLMLGFTVSTIMYHVWYPPAGTMWSGMPWSWVAATGGDADTLLLLTSGSDVTTSSHLKLPSFHE